MGAEIVAKKWAYKDSMGRSESEYQSIEQLSTNPYFKAATYMCGCFIFIWKTFNI